MVYKQYKACFKGNIKIITGVFVLPCKREKSHGHIILQKIEIGELERRLQLALQIRRKKNKRVVS